jgi:isoquinoline 1-oxidoreductase beta subunit
VVRGIHPDLNDETIDALFKAHLEEPGAVAKNQRRCEQGIGGSRSDFRTVIQTPYISHAQVEPINCTAHVEKERCRIWVPTQGQTFTQGTASKLTGLPLEKVEVMTLPAGGGFGLRAEQDPVVDSVLLSKALKRPVKVMWTREDDFANDRFRPAISAK